MVMPSNDANDAELSTAKPSDEANARGEPQSSGVSGQAGVFQDDPELKSICEQIYRERDRSKKPQ